MRSLQNSNHDRINFFSSNNMRSCETLTAKSLKSRVAYVTVFFLKCVRIIWAQSVGFLRFQRVSHFSIDDDDVSTFGLPVVIMVQDLSLDSPRGGRLIGASGTRWILMLMRERSREDNTSTREPTGHLYTPCVPYSVFCQVN